MNHGDESAGVGGDTDAAKPAIFIWGMGLIGASLGLRLKDAGFSVAGSVRSEKSRGELTALGFAEIYVDETESLAALRQADFLVLGLNLGDVYPVLDRVFAEKILRQKLIVFDLCSTKLEICNFITKKYRDALFIGVHPMAGKETRGPGAAEAGLFEGSTVFLTPLAHQAAALQSELTEKVSALWRKTGANTALIDPQTHDHTMAYLSHGLHLNACLIARLSAEVFDPKLTVSPAAGSYRDMTRIALSSGSMWNDITVSNKSAVAEWLRKLSAECNTLAASVETGNADITGLFAEAKKSRDLFMRT